MILVVVYIFRKFSVDFFKNVRERTIITEPYNLINANKFFSALHIAMHRVLLNLNIFLAVLNHRYMLHIKIFFVRDWLVCMKLNKSNFYELRCEYLAHMYMSGIHGKRVWWTIQMRGKKSWWFIQFADFLVFSSE